MIASVLRLGGYTPVVRFCQSLAAFASPVFIWMCLILHANESTGYPHPMQGGPSPLNSCPNLVVSMVIELNLSAGHVKHRLRSDNRTGVTQREHLA